MKIIYAISISVFSIMLMSIFMGGILYSVEQINDTTPIQEVLFWSALMLLFFGQIYRGLSVIGDQIQEYTQSKSKAKVNK